MTVPIVVAVAIVLCINHALINDFVWIRIKWMNFFLCRKWRQLIELMCSISWVRDPAKFLYGIIRHILGHIKLNKWQLHKYLSIRPVSIGRLIDRFNSCRRLASYVKFCLVFSLSLSTFLKVSFPLKHWLTCPNTRGTFNALPNPIFDKLSHMKLCRIFAWKVNQWNYMQHQH